MQGRHYKELHLEPKSEVKFLTAAFKMTRTVTAKVESLKKN